MLRADTWPLRYGEIVTCVYSSAPGGQQEHADTRYMVTVCKHARQPVNITCAIYTVKICDLVVFSMLFSGIGLLF